LQRLKYFYHKEAFLNLLELWYRLKQHIDNYTGGSDPDANEFEEDEEEEDDAPKEQYVENALKLLRLLACMVIKAENSDLQEIGDEKVQLFVSALKAGKEEAIFSRALECLKDKVAKESGQA